MSENRPGTTSSASLRREAGDPTRYNKRVPEDADQQRAGDGAASPIWGEMVRAGMNVGQQFAGALPRTFAMVTPDPALVQQSVRNLQAVSQAGAALARGAEDASRVWFDLAQRTARTNLEALGHLAGCRTAHDVMAVQTETARKTLRQMIEGGQSVADCSAQAMQQAIRAMEAAGPPV